MDAILPRLLATPSVMFWPSTAAVKSPPEILSSPPTLPKAEPFHTVPLASVKAGHSLLVWVGAA